MERVLFYLNLFFFLLVWLGAGAYTLLAILNLHLTYSVGTFWFFIVLLDIFALPLIWLWWHRGPKTISHKTWIMMAVLIVVLWWGLFTFYSLLSLHLNDLQFRWIAFVYIWEVIVVGGMAAYIIVRIVRFAELFFSNTLIMLPEEAHARIALIPWHASLVFTGIVIFGYAIGSLQLAYFSSLPFPEIVKNMLAGVLTGTFGSLLAFFLLERIVKPALQKSGAGIITAAMKATSGSTSDTQSNNAGIFSSPIAIFIANRIWRRSKGTKKRFSLFTKIYATTGILVLVSVGFFSAMAYSRGQLILEDQLRFRLQRELEFAAEQFHSTGILLSDDVKKERFGQHGELRLEIAKEGRTPPPAITIDRARSAKLVGTIPLDEMRYLEGTIFENDFNTGLRILLLFGLLVFFMILALVSIITTFFARSITGPIEEIKAGGIRMGKGIFSQHLQVYTNDELEDVGIALNEAAQKLEASYSDLETEVSLRTREVAEANKILHQQVAELDKTSRILVRRDFELQQINEQFRETDAAKSHFVSIAAHQLRTPLSAIKWTLHLLLAGDAGRILKDQRSLIAGAAESTERLIILVGDILDIARIESGKIIYNFAKFDVEAMIKKLFEEITASAKEKKIMVTFTREGAPLPEAVGDRERLMPAIQNILENAVHYTDEGGKANIILRRRDEQYYQIIVSDTGIGIPRHQQPLLFQKFFRADNALQRQIPGTGLALYMTQSIVKAHGGVIEVRSQEGQGSTFIVTLPFLK